MSKRTRYLLIAIGFLVFFTLAPIMVMYVTGVIYDSSRDTFVKTGILAVHVEPNDAKIFLDNKLVKNGEADIKFLKPGEYNLRLSKDGYFDWSNRVTVEPNVVNWIGYANAKIILLLKSTPKEIDSGVVDFTVRNNTLTILTNTKKLVTRGLADQTVKNYILSWQPSSLQVSNDQNYVLLSGSDKNEIYNLTNSTTTNLSNYFSASAKFAFGNGHDLLVLDKGVLYNFNFDSASLIKTPLISQVKNFSILNNSAYFIAQTPTSSVLSVLNLTTPQIQPILALPIFNQVDILASYSKQLALVADGKLYAVGHTLVPITDNITNYNFDQAAGTLIIVHSNELAEYPFSAQKLQFLTRSSEQLSNAVLRTDINYAFFYTGQTLSALRVDASKNQNQFPLYTAKQAGKILVDDKAQNIYILDSGDLKQISIR